MQATEETETLVVRAGEEIRLLPGEALQPLAALDGGLLRPVASTITAPSEGGEHWLAVASRDRLGRLSPIRWQRLQVDADAPRVSLTSRPEPVDVGGTLWVPGATRVEARASDEVAGVERLQVIFTDADGERSQSVDGERLEIELASQGEVTVRAQATDRVGWESEEARMNLSIDVEPPTGTLRFVGPQVAGAGPGGEIVIAPDTRLVADLEDRHSGLAGWSAQTDGDEAAAESWSGPWAAGEHSVAARARDRVGNEGVIGPLPLVVDAAPPQIAWEIGNQGFPGVDGTTWYIAPVEIRASARDAPAGLDRLEASLDGATFTPWEGARALDGDRLVLRASDRLGQTVSEAIRWQVDRQPPVIVLRDPAGQTVASGTSFTLIEGQALRVEVRDDQSGLVRSVHRLNDHPESAVPEVLRFLDRGLFSLRVRAVDQAGLETRSRWKLRVTRAPKEKGR